MIANRAKINNGLVENRHFKEPLDELGVNFTTRNLMNY